MSSYEALAGHYDELTEDVAYTRRADFIEKLMNRSRIPVKTVLDLACGTGTMTAIFTRRGYELIAVDGSEDMLAVAREKAAGLPGEPPVFIHQDMPKLDLYGTVEAAICCLDSLNYLASPRDLRRTLGRLRLFIQPGGVLIFDINTPYKLQGLDGQVFLDEREDVYCVWRTEFEKRSRICTYYMDLFTREQGDTCQRTCMAYGSAHVQLAVRAQRQVHMGLLHIAADIPQVVRNGQHCAQRAVSLDLERQAGPAVL